MEKNLQTLNRQEKIAVWSERIADCRSSGISVSGNVSNITYSGLIWLFKTELSLQQVGCRQMAVPGVGCGLIGPVSHRNDSRSPHLTVDPLAGAAEFRLKHVVEAVQPQGGMFLVQFHQFPSQRLIALLPPAEFP